MNKEMPILGVIKARVPLRMTNKSIKGAPSQQESATKSPACDEVNVVSALCQWFKLMQGSQSKQAEPAIQMLPPAPQPKQALPAFQLLPPVPQQNLQPLEFPMQLQHVSIDNGAYASPGAAAPAEVAKRLESSPEALGLVGTPPRALDIAAEVSDEADDAIDKLIVMAAHAK